MRGDGLPLPHEKIRAMKRVEVGRCVHGRFYSYTVITGDKDSDVEDMQPLEWGCEKCAGEEAGR